MRGKILAIAIVIISLLGGALMYWLQVYGYYEELSADTEIHLNNIGTGEAELLPTQAFEGIDAYTSPLRFRACFTTGYSLDLLTDTFEIYDGATPLVGPGWFKCFNALTIGHDLEQGNALAFLGQKNIRTGVDRVIAVYPNGQAYAWHQLNEIYAE